MTSAEARKMRAQLSGALWMVVGSVLVFGSVVLMNNLTDPPKPEADEARTRIDLASKPKPNKKKVVKKPEPRKRREAKTPPNPLRNLNSDIAGVDLGLPDFGGEMGDMADALLGDMGDVVMTDDSVDVPPKPKQQSELEYPPGAKAKGVTGYVILNLLIDASGSVDQVKVLEASPSGVFEEVAVSGVRRWRFEPAQYEGKKVRVWAKQKIRFDLS